MRVQLIPKRSNENFAYNFYSDRQSEEVRHNQIDVAVRYHESGDIDISDIVIGRIFGVSHLTILQEKQLINKSS